MDRPIRVTVWNEYIHERKDPQVRKIYPEGIHGCIADFLKNAGMQVRTATLEEPENGLPENVLNSTDVLFWWGHVAHERVEDKIVQRVCDRVLAGMGLIVLHSGHASKVFRKLMGTHSEILKWRENGEREILWAVDPAHPICDGIGEKIVLPQEETYGEFFNVPRPDSVVFVSWFSGGEVFRSGCCWHRGLGKVFYFRPGHEAFPVYRNPQVQRVLINAAKWACPAPSLPKLTSGMVAPAVSSPAV